MHATRQRYRDLVSGLKETQGSNEPLAKCMVSRYLCTPTGMGLKSHLKSQLLSPHKQETALMQELLIPGMRQACLAFHQQK